MTIDIACNIGCSAVSISYRNLHSRYLELWSKLQDTESYIVDPIPSPYLMNNHWQNWMKYYFLVISVNNACNTVCSAIGILHRNLQSRCLKYHTYSHIFEEYYYYCNRLMHILGYMSSIIAYFNDNEYVIFNMY